MSEDEERQYIRASIEAIERATGKRPIGWSGRDFQETPNTCGYRLCHPNVVPMETAEPSD